MLHLTKICRLVFVQNIETSLGDNRGTATFHCLFEKENFTQVFLPVGILRKSSECQTEYQAAGLWMSDHHLVQPAGVPLSLSHRHKPTSSHSTRMSLPNFRVASRRFSESSIISVKAKDRQEQSENSCSGGHAKAIVSPIHQLKGDSLPKFDKAHVKKRKLEGVWHQWRFGHVRSTTLANCRSMSSALDTRKQVFCFIVHIFS